LLSCPPSPRPQHIPPTCRPLVLSILADLLSDTRSHPFFHDWYLPAPTFGNTARNLASATVPTLPNALGTLASAIGVTPGSPAAAAAAAAGSGKLSAAGLLLGIWREQQLALGMADAKGVLNPSEEPWGCLLGAQGAVGGLEVAVAAGYGYLQPERRQLLDQLAAGYCPAQVLDKVSQGVWCGGGWVGGSEGGQAAGRGKGSSPGEEEGCHPPGNGYRKIGG
jgi:hypothetical protein